ncbi:VPLPA-CTERM sorting domain-containing protein [Jannaschia sp. CCS1]|uniref:VPLPA-CTERM sorting domain-containing protein n=1 Tax=Jannaschia sp. (strain CCS1) TaxID=290400 RepID=UPI000053DCF9|nr:VPLPA-CTERM sorting domain-containing protein [Jannaschia sp. CCS1]ABD54431.1 hypothetical protein Jann_1514 [Jannaschia sp. CCS1]
MTRSILFVAVAAAALLSAPAAMANSVLFSEDFTGQLDEGLFGEINAGDSFTATNGQWTISFAEDSASVDSEGAAVQDNIGTFDPFPTASAQLPGGEHFQWFEPEGPGVFRTMAVDITGFTDLTFSFDYFEIGRWDSADTSLASYSIDGGVTFNKIFNRNGETGGGSGSSDATQSLALETFSFAMSGGTSFIFSATVNTSASSEIAGLDNILLTGTAPAPIPLPASALLLLGGLAALPVMRRRRG